MIDGISLRGDRGEIRMFSYSVESTCGCIHPNELSMVAIVHGHAHKAIFAKTTDQLFAVSFEVFASIEKTKVLIEPLLTRDEIGECISEYIHAKFTGFLANSCAVS